MNTNELLKKVEGVQTVETVMDALGVDRKKAIYHLHRLRKKGYVKTRKLDNNKRVYSISFENRLKGFSYYDIINKYSPVKVVSLSYNLYGKSPSLEEALIFAIKTRDLRTILASIALFKRIDDWKLLYHLAKRNHLERQVGILYDLARKYFRTRRMSGSFRNIRKAEAFEYIIPSLRSDDFKDLEKRWRVYLPFNKGDMEDYA